jgi:hypothetical protein
MMDQVLRPEVPADMSPAVDISAEMSPEELYEHLACRESHCRAGWSAPVQEKKYGRYR